MRQFLAFSTFDAVESTARASIIGTIASQKSGCHRPTIRIFKKNTKPRNANTANGKIDKRTSSPKFACHRRLRP